MEHQAIYRRFRPRTFDEIAGQKHITETLKNQIIRNNVAHAYLFSGIRGTGKTSTAKIFARSVNCTRNDDGNPCNECESCISIMEDRNMDVIEMDAASNNSVNDIRDLREKVKFLPNGSKKKVYIIDEIHMLSPGAFNALLKTLEEPPEHILFILATTEPHKIPATILSRCQIFDFKRISVDEIMTNLEKICDSLGITTQKEALRVIANSAEGSLRDAQSILDRCVSYGQNSISYDDVIKILGSANFSIIADVIESIFDKNTGEAIKLTTKILSEGKDIYLFVQDIITNLRNILLLGTVQDGEKYVSAGEDNMKRLKDLSQKENRKNIIYYIEEFSELLSQMKKSLNSRILTEVKIIKMIKETSAATEHVSEKPVLYKSVVTPLVEKNTGKSDEKAGKVNSAPNTTQPSDSIKTEKNNEAEKEIYEKWEDILTNIRKEKINLYAVIKEGKPSKLENDIITVSFPPEYDFHLNTSRKKENKDIFEKVILGVTGKKYTAEFIADSNVSDQKKNDAQNDIVEEMKGIFGEEKITVIE